MNFKKNSPYADTPLGDTGNYLDQLVSRNVPISSSDRVIEISRKYHLRPDLMAYDLYGDSNLWWVFAERNPNALVDPVGDFVAGTRLFVPDPSNLTIALGL